MSKIVLIAIIVFVLGWGSILFVTHIFGKKDMKSVSKTVDKNVAEVQNASPTPIPTPVPTKLDYRINLNEELDNVNPEVLDSDFEGIDSLIKSF